MNLLLVTWRSDGYYKTGKCSIGACGVTFRLSEGPRLFPHGYNVEDDTKTLLMSQTRDEVVSIIQFNSTRFVLNLRRNSRPDRVGLKRFKTENQMSYRLMQKSMEFEREQAAKSSFSGRWVHPTRRVLIIASEESGKICSLSALIWKRGRARFLANTCTWSLWIK